MVKRELASVLVFESHSKKGTVLFRQGDEGKSWYIILKGSVNVSIYGKGTVCQLQEGDDFGKLALVNDAPRSATIFLCEDNCHFLRVDKDDFNRILRDVEANTVRLNEHGQDVLVLEKMPTNIQAQDGSIQSHYKYSVMAGTPEKILEHLLETRMEKTDSYDHFLESFLLTHVIFMPTKKLCPALRMHYEATAGAKHESHDITVSHKCRVIQFVQEWQSISGDEFLEDNTISAFLKELHQALTRDCVEYPELKNDLIVIEHMIQLRASNVCTDPAKYSVKKRLTPNVTLARKGSNENLIDDSKFRRGPIKATDETIFRVYCADHSYCTLRVPMTTTVSHIIAQAQEKLSLGEDLVLCEVKSNGERILFRENDLGIVNSLSLNGRLFLTPREHLDAVTPLPEQDDILSGTASSLELVGSQELAYHMTIYDWELFTSVPEYELIYQVFGRYKFAKMTANLDLFLRRFNEVQYWVVTEILLTQNLNKRVHLLRKFIKLASYCKEYQNMSSFFAIVLGLSNIAVSRLSQTWEKLPGKLKKMFSEFETIMDPSRNHRVYRLSISKMRPPIIPFMPLMMKDMTFTHEGNKTYYDGLVNFEKMHMIAQTLRTVRCCRSMPLNLDIPSSSVKPPFEVKAYVRNLCVMDNQRTLTQLSHKLEPRRT
ncbi:rap guanine nucleotide exchange factor 4 isoform X1 [Octopus bimaculoides]|uniref:Rap guanine nucleotide exchange factor 4 n=1 Tax=Octopus bimaculoides TaxID=37653 RepID=A0A0L8I1A8_OCTBM|nr:rap guanine nucleotide exchange factor 4 isoform X1 [Octopus bimaculoides]|eukprot:XP_014767653.1 PREDICTED: rap guanine nucleotide exchange factor 4-like [Octopus bimaculoides]